MNFMKRAFRSVGKHKVNSLIMITIFTVISVLILSGLCVAEGARQAGEKSRRSIGATVSLQNGEWVEYGFYGENSLSYETVQKLAADERVSRTELSVQGEARPSGFSPYETKQQRGLYEGKSSLKICGDTDMLQNGNFTAGKLSLYYGRGVNAEDTDACVVWYKLAETNGWKIGDKIQVIPRIPSGAVFLEGPPVEMTLVGYFAVTTTESNTGAPEFNLENSIYTTPQIAMKANGNQMVTKAVFHLKDPLDTEAFVADYLMAKNYHFSTDNSDYLLMQSGIEATVTICLLLAGAAVIIGTVIVTLIMMNSFLERSYEVGILLSIGESKGKVIAQLILEYLFTILLAMTLGSLVCRVALPQISGMLASADIVGTINPMSVILLFAAGILLTLLASLVIIWKVARYQPKKILMAIE